MLGELNCRKRGLLVNTKYLPAIHPAEYFGGPLDLAKHIPEGWGSSLLSSATAIVKMLTFTSRFRPALPSRYAPSNSTEVPHKA